MGLYKRQDSPIWWMTFSASGRAYRRSTGTDNKKLADSILSKVKTQIAEGKWFEKEESPEEYSLRELADKYKAFIKGRQKSEKVKGYIIGQLLDYFGEDRMLSTFTTYGIEQLQTANIERSLSNSANNKQLNIIKNMFKKAKEWKMVTDIVVKDVYSAKLLVDESQRLRFLSKDECKTLVDACEPLLRPIVVTALNTGMRKGELLTLKWDQADLKHGFILLAKTKNGERREIPINNTLRSVLQGIVRHISVPYVFYNPETEAPWCDLKKSWARALKAAKITDFHLHDLRHTFASHLVMAGIDIMTVKDLLGHKTLKMTLRYAHLAPSHRVRAVEIYDDFMGGENSPKGEAVG